MSLNKNAPKKDGKPEDARCDCGSLLYRRVEGGIEIKCRRCKRVKIVKI